MGLKRVTQREAAAYVYKRNGAWFVSIIGSGAHEGAPPSDLYDCAAGLPAAKRIAVQLAKGVGYEGAVRWSASDVSSRWTLEMTWPSEHWDGEYDE